MIFHSASFLIEKIILTRPVRLGVILTLSLVYQSAKWVEDFTAIALEWEDDIC
jgi:hypothetical protein